MELNEYKKMDEIEATHPWFVAKREFLGELLNRFAPQGKVLDVGCGSGAVLSYLKNKGYQVEGIDSNVEALRFCENKGLIVKQSPGSSIPFSDGAFDVVVALDVLEHIEDDKAAAVEMKRVLKKGGFLISTVPAHQFLWSSHDEFLHHVRRYNQNNFRKVFDSAGFSVRYISYLHFFSFFPITVSRLTKKLLKIKENDSEVRYLNKIFGAILSVLYQVELLGFKIFGKLPFGLSLIVIAENSNEKLS